MNVLLVHQAFASPKEAGGTRHYELAHHIVKHGGKFTIVASEFSYLTGKRNVEKGRKVEDLDGVKILRAYTYPTLHRSFTWRIVSFLSFMVSSIFAALKEKDVDVIMGTTPPIFQAGSAWLVARMCRHPFLLEIRDLWPEFAIDLGVLTNPFLISLSRWFEKFLYNHATHLLVNSPAYKDYLIAKRVPSEKITLIPNGVDIALFDPDARGEEYRERFALNDKFVVTYAGALGLANDIDTILAAAARLKNNRDFYFLIIGDGKDRIRLEEKARKEGLSRVIFAGSYPKSEMKDILAASDVCVATLKDIPMFRTTYPNKVFDYMAAGRPIVLGIDGVIRKVVDEAKAGIYVHPGNDKDLAKAIESLHKNPDESKSMGMAGRLYVMRYFNRAKQAEDFMRLIKKITTQQ